MIKYLMKGAVYDKRGPGAMAVDRGQRGRDQRCFNCGGFGHIAQNCMIGRPVDKNGRVI